MIHSEVKVEELKDHFDEYNVVNLKDHSLGWESKTKRILIREGGIPR
jgi:hypothetical protein